MSAASTAPAPIRALLVDDEPLARRGLRQLLAGHADVVVVGESRDGRDALAALATLAPDVVFLDVQMPELDGLDVLRTFARAHGADRLPAVVFLTAYEDFAVEAFEVEALDYLVKPVTPERFAAALARVRRHLDGRRAGARATPPPPPAATTGPAAAGGLLVRTARGQTRLAPSEIAWVAADDYCVTVHARGRRYLLRESLDALEERLAPAGFLRVHRSALVNLARVRHLLDEGGEAALRLDDGTRLPVSRRRRAALARAWRRATSDGR